MPGNPRLTFYQLSNSLEKRFPFYMAAIKDPV